jgi:hypothetical protein
MNVRMDAAVPVDAQTAPTGTWKTAQTAVSHSAHTHHHFRKKKAQETDPHTKNLTLPQSTMQSPINNAITNPILNHQSNPQSPIQSSIPNPILNHQSNPQSPIAIAIVNLQSAICSRFVAHSSSIRGNRAQTLLHHESSDSAPHLQAILDREPEMKSDVNSRDGILRCSGSEA